MINLAWGGATDIGPVRKRNEDSLFADAPVFVVADGMGGHCAGDEASDLAVTQFKGLAGTRVSHAQILDRVGEANRAILTRGSATDDRAGMGTTLAGLALIHDGNDVLWLAFNIGDSRIYRIAGGVLEQLSKDHSQVQALVDAGQIEESERHAHPLGHVVTRALGSDPSPEPDCWLLWPVAGERFLLCTDGVTGWVPDDEIRAHLLAEAQPEAAASRVIQAALSAGSKDNVTAVVVEVRGDAGDSGETGPRQRLDGLA